MCRRHAPVLPVAAGWILAAVLVAGLAHDAGGQALAPPGPSPGDHFAPVSGLRRAETETAMFAEGRALRDALVGEADRPGKPEWKPMLLYLAELHGRSVCPKVEDLP
ncbi:MAG: hypothetical protein ACYC6Y_23375 [Thermoguttaceae bacterium]